MPTEIQFCSPLQFQKMLKNEIDAQVLNYFTLLRLYRIPISFYKCSNPEFSPSGKLPCIIMDQRNVYPPQEIISTLNLKLNYEIDSFLNLKEKSILKAFESLLDSTLKFALDYELWYDTVFFQEYTLSYYNSLYPFPLNQIVPRMRRATIVDEMLAHHPVLNTIHIFSLANAALGSVSELLGDKPFLFGTLPSSLDAKLFSYIHIAFDILSREGLDSRYYRIVKPHDNLKRYHSRIIKSL